jgi:predicted aconitase
VHRVPVSDVLRHITNIRQRVFVETVIRPPSFDLSKYMEQELKIKFEQNQDGNISALLFEEEKDFTWFLLKWS